MQHFRDNEKKQIKMTVSRPFFILFLQNYITLSPYILFSMHAWSSYFALILSSVNITKFLKFKIAARPPFLNCLLPRGNQVID